MKRAVGFQTGPTWVDNWQGKLLWVFTLVLLAAAVMLVLKLNSVMQPNAPITGYSLIGAGNLVAGVPGSLADLGYEAGSATRGLTDENGSETIETTESEIVEEDLIEIAEAVLTVDPDETPIVAKSLNTSGSLRSDRIEVLNVNGETRVVGYNELDFESFEGSLEITPDGVTLIGSVEQFSSDGMVALLPGEEISVSMGSGELDLNGDVSELTLKGEGTITFANGSSINLRDDGIVLKDFSGQVSYNISDAQIELSGNIGDSELIFR
ncbi:MAG: hypothetical protein GOV15_01135 [Candidatus Diapherotrites archaeon]|nr:hypothetical protein [Candidatus Diapherotrites archaeon]